MKKLIPILTSLIVITLIIIACTKEKKEVITPEPTISLPTLTIADISTITEISCTSGGNVITDGNARMFVFFEGE